MPNSLNPMGLRMNVMRGAGLLAAVLVSWSALQAQSQTVRVGKPLRRDWWVSAPGGYYGLMEVRQADPTSDPTKARSRTSILVGPWRWTFDATAPQVITVVTIPVLVTAFTYGWIRTRRR